MARQHEVRVKLKVLSAPGIGWVITDLLRALDSNAAGDETDEEYARLAKSIIRELKMKYQNQIAGQQVASKQTDIEDLIATIKQEEQYKLMKDETTEG